MVQFLDPEIAKIPQFLDPEIVNMDKKFMGPEIVEMVRFLDQEIVDKVEKSYIAPDFKWYLGPSFTNILTEDLS